MSGPGEVQFRRLHPEAILPKRMSEDAAGLDLHARVDEPVRLAPGDRHAIPTGWQMAIPRGFEGQVRPRSGLALNRGLTIPNAPGTIDADYRGEVKVILQNLGDEAVEIRDGDRIAQLVICPVVLATPVEVEILSPTRRGAAGFGSTGVN